MTQFEYDVLENAKTYLNQLKDDLEKQKAQLMDVYVEIRDYQKSIDEYIILLKNILNNYDVLKVNYDFNKEEEIPTYTMDEIEKIRKQKENK